MDDRRISNRVPLNVKVTYTTYGMEQKGFSTDLSSLGIFIESKNPPAKGAKLLLQFILPLPKDKSLIRASGIVERIVDRNEAGQTFSIPGMGVRFVSFEDDGEKKVKTFVGLKLLAEKKRIMSPPPPPKPTRPVPEPQVKTVTEQPAPAVPVEKPQMSTTQKNRLARKKRYERAEKAFGEGLRTYRTGDHEKAILLMKEATQLNPNKPSYFNALKEMEESYRKKTVVTVLDEVNEDIKKARYDIASQKLKRCLKIVSDDPQIVRLMAKTLILKGKNQAEALNWANKAYSMRVSDPENQYILGLAYKKMGNKERAKALFLKAVQSNGHAEALQELENL